MDTSDSRAVRDDISSLFVGLEYLLRRLRYLEIAFNMFGHWGLLYPPHIIHSVIIMMM